MSESMGTSLVDYFRRCVQMSEIGAMASAAFAVIAYGGGLGVASYLGVGGRPPRKLALIAGSAFTAHMLLTRYVATGALTPSNRRAEAMMEAWLRRLDGYVKNGAAPEATCTVNTNTAATQAQTVLLAPLAIVTGADSGLGMKTAENLLTCGWMVVMAQHTTGPSVEKARQEIIVKAKARLTARYKTIPTDSIDRLRADALIASLPYLIFREQLDLSDEDSIRAFVEGPVRRREAEAAESVVAGRPGLAFRHDGLRLLVNNAGVYEGGYNKWTKSGVQRMFSINYGGPSYLTSLVMKHIITPRMSAVAAANNNNSGSDASHVVPFRTVTLGSCANLWALGVLNPRSTAELTQMMAQLIPAMSDKTQTAENNSLIRGILGDTYGISKLGLIALAHNEAQRAAAAGVSRFVTAFSVHPGGVRTNVFNGTNTFMRILYHLFSQFVFKSQTQGANNQTFLSLMLIDEQTKFDPISMTVAAALTQPPSLLLPPSPCSNNKNSSNDSAKLGDFIIPCSLSGKFLIDAGEGKGGVVSKAACPEVYAVFDEWTANHVAKIEGRE